MRTIQRALAALILAALGCVVACAGHVDDGASSSCPPDQAFFVERMWKPTLSTKCIACHSETGLARGSRFVLTDGNDDATLQHDLEVTTKVAAIQVGGESILLLRPTGKYPGGHPGGTLFLPGSSE